jgi:pimeloyl-ACP methyl ester carboxylesterase
LAKHCWVIALDLRGYNESEKPLGKQNYRISILLNDIMEFIRFLGQEKAIVLGHGLGGYLAWNFAMQYPQAVEKLIVLNCPHPFIFAKTLRSNWKQFFRSFYLHFCQIPWIPEFLILRDPHFFIKALFAFCFQKKASEDEIWHFAKAIAKPGVARAAFHYYRANWWNFFQICKPVPLISCPTLLLWSEKNPLFLTKMTYAMETYFEKKICIQYIKECGHCMHLEQPEIVNQKILTFLLHDPGNL